MAIDEDLNERFRKATAHLDGITERKMMGGTCFMLNGNMLGGADCTKTGQRRFMFRVGKNNEAEALKRDGTIMMEQGGRKMTGLIFVDEASCSTAATKAWIKLALSFVGDLPPK